MMKTKQLNIRINRRTREVLESISTFWDASYSDIISILLEQEYRRIKQESGGSFRGVEQSLYDQVTRIEVFISDGVVRNVHYGRRPHDLIDWPKTIEAFRNHLHRVFSLTFKNLGVEDVVVTIDDSVGLLPEYKAWSNNLDVTNYHLIDLRNTMTNAVKQVERWVVMDGEDGPAWESVASMHLRKIERQLEMLED